MEPAHSFRHTHISLLSEAEVSFKKIMKHLGHRNDKITKRIDLRTTKPIRKQDSKKFKILMDFLIDFEPK